MQIIHTNTYTAVNIGKVCPVLNFRSKNKNTDEKHTGIICFSSVLSLRGEIFMILFYFEYVPLLIILLVVGAGFLGGIGLGIIINWFLSHLIILGILLFLKGILSVMIATGSLGPGMIISVPIDMIRSLIIIWLLLQTLEDSFSQGLMFIIILPLELLVVFAICTSSAYAMLTCSAYGSIIGEAAAFLVQFLWIYLFIYKFCGGWDKPLEINKTIPIIKDLQEIGMVYLSQFI